MMQKQFAEALPLFEKGVELTDDKPELRSQFYSYLADCYYNLDSVERAFKMFDEVLKINPNDILVLNNYAYSTDTRWAQTNISWYTPYLLLKQLPFLKKKNFDEALHLRSVAVYDRKVYTEVGYSAGLYEMARIGVFAGFDDLKFRSVGVSVSIPLSMLREY